jgi:O-antigen ligase
VIDRSANKRLVSPWTWVLLVVVFGGAAFFGSRPSQYILLLLVGGVGLVLLLSWPRIGLLAIVPSALLLRIRIDTGSAVALNVVALLVPVLIGIWFLDMLRRDSIRFVASRCNRPLVLFLLSGLLSLAIGTALWDPAVPRSGGMFFVQLAQWGIFALSAGAFWLTANLVSDIKWLRWLVFSYLVITGIVAMLYVLPDVGVQVSRRTSGVMNRAPIWALLAAISAGQLFFNRELGKWWRWLLIGNLIATLVYAFYWNRETVSVWAAVLLILGMLAWLRWPRIRRLAIFFGIILLVTGTLSSALYDLAGGDAEWEESGGSRLVLISRVVEVTMRNPITGLGPAAYRVYASQEPLGYGEALWWRPVISSHNNYVDLFSHVGLLGLGLFVWFAVEVIKVAVRLRTKYTDGFVAGYVNGVLAAWVGSLVLMMFADWILPFVYNIGFFGFQASVLVWLFLGGLVALDSSRLEPTTERVRD